VVPWLRRSYPKFNFSQKREEPLAMASGLGDTPIVSSKNVPLPFPQRSSRVGGGALTHVRLQEPYRTGSCASRQCRSVLRPRTYPQLSVRFNQFKASSCH